MYVIIAFSSACPLGYAYVYMSLFRMNRRARFLARVEQEAQDEASVHEEAPAPDAAAGRRGSRRARRARQAAEIEPEVPQADFNMQAFLTSMQDNNVAIRDSMILMQQMMVQQQRAVQQQETQSLMALSHRRHWIFWIKLK